MWCMGAKESEASGGLPAQELEYLEQVSPVKWTVKTGFVPGMRVPGGWGSAPQRSCPL